MNKDRVIGVYTASLTPVDQELNIDHNRLFEHVTWLLDSGCHGAAIFGTTGEATSFSQTERIDALDELIERGIDPSRLLVGTGCCALTDSVQLTRHALSVGCTNVLMLPPFYYKGASDHALADSFGAVIDRMDDPRLGIILYHFPRLSGVPITEGLVAELVKRYPDTIVGIKDSGGDFDNTARMILTFPDLNVFPGSEKFLTEGLRLGGAGCITATGNTNPGGPREVWDAWEGNVGDSTVDALQSVCTKVREAVEAYPLVTVQKAWLAEQRGDPAWKNYRPPMEAVDEATSNSLRDHLQALEFRLAS